RKRFLDLIHPEDARADRLRKRESAARPLLGFAYKAAKERPHVKPEQGQVPEVGDHLCREALARARDANQRDAFWCREPEVARILRERPLTQGEPVLENCKAPDVLRGLGITVKLQRVRGLRISFLSAMIASISRSSSVPWVTIAFENALRA